MRYVSQVTALGDKIDEIPQRMRSTFPDIREELFWDLYKTASKPSFPLRGSIKPLTGLANCREIDPKRSHVI
jgi:hypothetical protein